MITLGVNVDHVATLRQARGTSYPSPLEAAYVAARHGADQITIHLREDRRHIQDSDVEKICLNCPIPVNLEMAFTAEMTQIALQHVPSVVTIVPERREERTTEGGLDLRSDQDQARIRVKMVRDAGIETSAFIEPDLATVKQAAKIGYEAVEFHTGTFANLITNRGDWQNELDRINRAGQLAYKMGLRVAAGHGLTKNNLDPLLGVGYITEFNIGHALISDAVYDGLGATVQSYKYILSGAISQQ